MGRGINLPRSEGASSRQAHVDLPQGTYERELGREGFFGPATEMYHRHPPTAWIKFEGPLRPHAFDTTKLANAGEDSFWQAAGLLANAHTQIRLWRMQGKMDHLVRNADGDELLFLHQGKAEFFCDYGHLSVTEGDYIAIPRGTMWRIEADGPLIALAIEATNGSYSLPEKGMVGHHAIFDPAVLDTPHINDAFKQQQDEREWRVVVKRSNQLTTITYPFNPLDAIGWCGTLMPLRVNWRDIRPLMSHRYHLPPSAHTTFVAQRFVVCTFCPRPMESDPGALKVPFFHSNDDFDEVIFYHQGEFFSRDNIHPGMITFHPSGFPHGPHPKALAAGVQASRKDTNEVAVMIDTRDALGMLPSASSIEWTDYADSWKESKK
ncbi:MAG: homogentisate 1,2-dioxygenase [Gammaproteobacteria bacterium]|nr:homogentisate 1,2-dioxygenase [Gammaproteobacteria bacterium]